MKRLLAIVITAAALAVNLTPVAQAAGCPSVNKNWAGPGPYAVTSASNGQGTTIIRPAQLGTLGCAKHPVILWSNGAAATVSAYQSLLEHFASHGFIVAAGEGRSSSGAPLLAGLDYLTTQNGTAGSVFAGKVDLAHVGATGHSLGGGAAVGAGADPRVDTVAPLEGGPFNDPAKLHGPALYFAGQADILVWPSVVHDRYAQSSHVPAIYAELKGADHFVVSPDGGQFRGAITAWFRFWLLGDEQARAEFFGQSCVNCTSPIWSKFERNAKASSF